MATCPRNHKLTHSYTHSHKNIPPTAGVQLVGHTSKIRKLITHSAYLQCHRNAMEYEHVWLSAADLQLHVDTTLSSSSCPLPGLSSFTTQLNSVLMVVARRNTVAFKPTITQELVLEPDPYHEITGALSLSTYCI